MSMQVIEHIELASAASTIEFASIGGDYTDLLLMLSLRGNNGLVSGKIVFNVTGGTYTRRRLLGTGASVNSATPTSDFLFTESADTAGAFNNASIYIPNYTSSLAKSYSVDSVTENNGTTAYQGLFAGLWSETDAITNIKLLHTTGAYVQYSSATLFGVTAGQSGTTTVS